ncbi:MAG: alpha/beta hydrolase [Ktedonobacteraceae bacterium]
MLPQKQNEPFSFGPEDAEKACLIIHGFTGIAGEVRGLGESLAIQGIRTLGIALAGHSGDPEDLAHSTRKDWIASTEAGLAELAQHKEVFVAGLSMGGVLALMLAAHHPERIAGVIAMSTPTRFARSWMIGMARPFMKWFYPFKPFDLRNPKIQKMYLNSLNWQIENPSIDFSDPQVVAEIKQIRMSIAALHELAQLLVASRAALKQVRCPLLVIQSKRDKTVNPVCANELMQLAANAHPKTLRWLEESGHVITLGPEREEVFVLSREFIDAPLVAPAAWDAPATTSSSDQAGA